MTLKGSKIDPFRVKLAFLPSQKLTGTQERKPDPDFWS